MANNPSTVPGYNGQTAAPDGNYTYGSARDDAAPGDLTGTPRIAAEINDIMGVQQELLVAAGIVPSGTPDKVGASQYADAIFKLAGRVFDNVADMAASTRIRVGDRVNTNGYGAAGDGGGAKYLILPTGSTVFPGYVLLASGMVAKLDENEANVLQFGADRTGASASDAAFLNASAFAADAAIDKKKVTIPAGVFLLTQANSMKVNISGNTNGFTWEGAGLGATIINFINTGSITNNYLVDNQDDELRVSYRGIRFQGDPTEQNARFYRMESTGTAQSPRFFDCMWYQFYSVLDVTDAGGATNASEPLFWACKTSNIYGPAFTCDNVQSLNWNFHGCDLESHFDDVFRFTKGGVLNVWGGSMILTGGNLISTDGGTSVIGSNNWTYNFWGVRTELHDTARLVSMKSAGKITFNECNLEVITGDSSREIGLVEEGGYVSVNGGHVNGKFTLTGGSASAYAIPWRQATLYVQGSTIGSNFDVDVTVLANSGGMGRYKIRDCKKSQAGADPTTIVDQDFGWELGYTGMATNSKFVIVNRQAGTLPGPGNSNKIILPEGSRVISYRMVHDGQSGPAGLIYRLQNDDGSVVHDTFNFNATDTVNAKVDCWILATGLNQTFTVENDAASPSGFYDGYIVIEYL